MEMYVEKFGRDRTEQMVPQMAKVGSSVGIKFSYGGYTGNTFDSHRLIWKSREEGGSALQDKVVESLFKAYFEEEQSMGEEKVLMECAERAGMDAAKLFEDTNIGKKETLRELQNEICQEKIRYFLQLEKEQPGHHTYPPTYYLTHN